MGYLRAESKHSKQKCTSESEGGRQECQENNTDNTDMSCRVSEGREQQC